MLSEPATSAAAPSAAAPCPVCDALLAPGDGVILSELVTCRECGLSLEVTGLDPLRLAEAPAEEEDWGE